MILAVIVGVWLIMIPTLERQEYMYLQEALIDDILQGFPVAYDDSSYYYNTVYSNEPCNSDYYDGTDNVYSMAYEDLEEAIGYEPCIYYLYEVPTTYANLVPAVTPNPIPESEFPSEITGLGILTIDRINLRLPVAEGVAEDTLKIAVGRVPQTAQIGDIGNAVIAGHRNYTFGQMFNRLGELEIGDVIEYQAKNGEVMQFVVFEVAVIVPDDQIAFVQPTKESIITLYTCTPIRTATHRLLVRAQRTPIIEERK